MVIAGAVGDYREPISWGANDPAPYIFTTEQRLEGDVLSFPITGMTECLIYPPSASLTSNRQQLQVMCGNEPDENQADRLCVFCHWRQVQRPPQDLAVPRRQLWQQLADEPGHERFFHLLEPLHDTQAYRYATADQGPAFAGAVPTIVKEVQALQATVTVAPRPGPASPQPGPSTRR